MEKINLGKPTLKQNTLYVSFNGVELSPRACKVRHNKRKNTIEIRLVAPLPDECKTKVKPPKKEPKYTVQIVKDANGKLWEHTTYLPPLKVK